MALLKLFQEFPPISTEMWEDTIKKDLKGADYNKKLLWKTIEGINVKPYYRAEHLNNNYSDTLPGEYPYVRGTKVENNWYVRQDIIIDTIDEANKKAIEAISKGAESIGFNTKNITITSQSEFTKLVKGINFEKYPVHFISEKHTLNILDFFAEEIKIQKLNKQKIFGSVTIDPLGYLTTKGKFFDSEKSDFSLLKIAVECAKNNLPNVKIISVSGYFFHNAGSSIVQELGYSLALGNEYLSKLSDAGLSIDEILKNLHFNFAVGSNYFMEIAKFRAARLLWTKIAEAYKPSDTENLKINIHAVTSSWNKTIFDPFVNVLRTTTESMSAAIAGVNSLSVKPFDLCYKKSDNFSERVARNQQIILKEEAFLSKIVDASAGSYYIENLTASIAEEAWKIFLSCENNGGYINAFKQNIIQNEIQNVANQRDLNIATRKDILLGTNQHPNPIEKASKKISTTCNHKKTYSRDDLIANPIKQYRGAQAFENIRLGVEIQNKKKPKVFLFTYGSFTKRKARAGFSSNLFACAGYDVIDNSGFTTIDEGVNECLKQKAHIVVICSSDDEYAEIVPAIYEKLHSKAIVVLAGYPKNLIEQFKAFGLKHFIYSGMNVLESLQNFQNEIK